MKTQGWLLAVSLLAMTVLPACGGQSFGLSDETQSFAQTAVTNNKVDVLLVVDTSSGMSEHYADIAAAAPSFVSALLSKGLDLHVAIITTSMGGTNPNGGAFLNNRYWTSADPNLASSLVSQMQSLQSNGSDLTRGLDSVIQVVSPTYANGAGRGFLRSDALLAVIPFTDQDDHSVGQSTSAAYIAMFDTLKGKFQSGARKWSVNFVGVLNLTSTCLSTGGPGGPYHDPGVRWMDLSAASGGINSTLCTTDLSQAVSNINIVIEQILTDYYLGAIPPNMSTLVVTIDGAVIPQSATNGWQYIPATNSIRFYGSAIPKLTSIVKVTFTPSTAN